MRKWWPELRIWLLLILLPATGIIVGASGTLVFLGDQQNTNNRAMTECNIEWKDTATRLSQTERMMSMCISTVESSAQETAVCIMKLQRCVGVK